MIKLIISVIIVLLIPANTVICEIIFPGDHNIDNWWFLRTDIYCAVIAWFCYLSTAPPIKYGRVLSFIMYIAIAWTSSDVVDKWFLNTRVFTPADIIVTIVAVFLGIKKFYPSLYSKIKSHVKNPF